jgi:hypothetical protein
MMGRIRFHQLVAGTGQVILLAFGPLACSEPAAPTPSVTLIDCTPGTRTSDSIGRGFYIDSFPGVRLDRVDLSLRSQAVGEYRFALMARENVYDGPLIASDTIALSISAAPSTFYPATFDLSATQVATGSVVTFDIDRVSGPAVVVSFELTSDTTCPIIETEGVSPPLDTFRRPGLRATIHGAAP